MTYKYKQATALCVILALLIQGCTSVHFNVQSDAERGTGTDTVSDKRFSAKITQSGPLDKDDQDAVYNGIISAFKQEGLRPAGTEGSDFLISVAIKRDPPSQGLGFGGGLSLATALITLFIVPFVSSDDYVADVTLTDTSNSSTAAQFSIPFKYTECWSSLPLAYLCVNNSGAMGRDLGEQISGRINKALQTPKY